MKVTSKCKGVVYLKRKLPPKINFTDMYTSHIFLVTSVRWNEIEIFSHLHVRFFPEISQMSFRRALNNVTN